MIKKLSFISVFMLCFFAIDVNAQEAPGSSPTGNNALDQRVTERILKLKTDLDTGQISQLKTRCKAAQNRLAPVKKSAEEYASSRTKSIDRIIENTTALLESLKQQEIDTQTLSATLEKMEQVNSHIESTQEDYIIALEDSIEINCEGNPEGFRSSVDDAKEQFSNLKKLRAEMFKLIKTDLKAAVTDLRDRI